MFEPGRGLGLEGRRGHFLWSCSSWSWSCDLWSWKKGLVYITDSQTTVVTGILTDSSVTGTSLIDTSLTDTSLTDLFQVTCHNRVHHRNDRRCHHHAHTLQQTNTHLNDVQSYKLQSTAVNMTMKN